MGTDTNRFVAGPVVFSLGMICIALFATAGTIIRQIIHTYSTAAKYALPIIGYLAAVVCFIGGMTYISDGSTVAHFVAGHVICGVAFITACVATTATSSTRFTFITQNSRRLTMPYLQSHSLRHRRTYSSFWLLCSPSLHGFGHSGYWDKVISTRLLCGRTRNGRTGITLYKHSCLVATIVRQIRNSYSGAERKWWPALVLVMGTLSILWGLWVLTDADRAVFHRIHYDRSGFSLLQYIQQSNSAGCYFSGTSLSWRTEFRSFRCSPRLLVFSSLLFCLK